MSDETKGVDRRTVLAASGAGFAAGAAGGWAVSESAGPETVMAWKRPRAMLLGPADVTPALQDAVNRLRVGGGVVTVGMVEGVKELLMAGSLVLPGGVSLHLPAGVRLRRVGGSPEPLVVLSGRRSHISGRGMLIGTNPTPHGLVMIGPPTPTKSSYSGRMSRGGRTLTVSGSEFESGDTGRSISIWGAGSDGEKLVSTISRVHSSNEVVVEHPATTTVTGAPTYWGRQAAVAWASIEDVHLMGDGSESSVGLYFNSSPQGSIGLTVGCGARYLVVERVGTGIRFGPQANGNMVTGVQFQRITSAALDFRDSVENTVVGGFVHHSKSLPRVVRGERSVFNSVWSLAAEPGGPSRPFELDDLSEQNVIQVMHNSSVGGIDDGRRNVVMVRDRLHGQRVTATGGLVLPLVGDPDALVGTPETGLMVATPEGLAIRQHDNWRTLTGASPQRDVSRVSIRHPDMASGRTYDVDAGVDGANPGDALSVTCLAPPPGLMWNAWIPRPGSMRLRLASYMEQASGELTFAVKIHGA